MIKYMLPTAYYIELPNGLREYHGPLDLVMAFKDDFAPRVGDLWLG